MKGVAPVIILVALFVLGVSMIAYAVYPVIDLGNWTIDVQNEIADNSTDETIIIESLDIPDNETNNTDEGVFDSDDLGFENVSDNDTSNSTNSTNSTSNVSFIGGGSSGGSYTPPAEPEQEPVMIIRPTCPDNYGLNATTIVFYYVDEPHSAVMIPIVEELEANYSFFKTDDLWNKNAYRCFDLFGQTPAFVCAGSKAQLFGEVSKEVLEEFAKNCS